MKYAYFIGASLVFAAPAWAQGEKPYEAAPAYPCPDDGTDCILAAVKKVAPDDTITVTATGRWSLIDEAGQSISVITASQLEAVQGQDLTRVLERLPGVTLARSGGLGSQTSLFVRGAGSQQVVVTVDGVRMADVAAPSGGTDLGTLLTGGFGRIELLRGSNSAIWGSDAIGGVLALTSAEVDGAAGSLEFGANNTVSGDLRAGIERANYAVSLSGGYSESDGISAFALGREADPFRQWNVSARARANLGERFKLIATARHADSRIAFDGYPAPLYEFADTDEYQITRQTSGRVGFELDGDSLDLRGGFALSGTERAYYDPLYGTAPNFETSGRSLRADLAGRTDLGGAFVLDFGADSEWTRFSTSYDPRQSARLSSGYALLGWYTGRVSLSGSVRLTDHDRFGSHWTFGANGSFDLGGGWRLRASYGEGFKAPTLYQLYGYGGNPFLMPETSRAFETGLEFRDRIRGLRFSATLFRRDNTDLIDYVWPAGYENIGQTRAQGFELEGSAQVSDRFAVRAAYTYLDATNRDTGSQLARRPRHALSASADWTSPLAGLTLGADLRMVGDSFDDAGNFTALDGYALVTLRASVPVGQHIELYGRVENVTDEQYQTVAGYGTYGRSAYAGVRVKW